LFGRFQCFVEIVKAGAARGRVNDVVDVTRRRQAFGDFDPGTGADIRL
jgi:hypothetical protein